MTVRQQHNNDDGGNNKSNSTNSSNTSNANAVANLARPKSVSQWSQIDVQKWLRKTCSDYYHLYAEKFLDQDITGRSLIRLNENSLLRLEIVNPDHRQAILRAIAKLRLRSSILQLRDMETRQTTEIQ